jgi:hypothetical protein
VREGPGLEKHWVLSQGGEGVLRTPPFPHKEASAEAPEEDLGPSNEGELAMKPFRLGTYAEHCKPGVFITAPFRDHNAVAVSPKSAARQLFSMGLSGRPCNRHGPLIRS